MKKMLLKTLKISSPDAAQFLQALITADVRELEAQPIFSAACNQKGRIIANFWIARDKECFYLQLPESMSTLLLEHFKKYLFRSKVTFETIEKNEEEKYDQDENVIWILPETTEQFIPQMINLEKKGGVSFKKGCYLGQEIVARTQHLGKLKRHLKSFTLESIHPLVSVGDALTNQQGEKVGTVVSVSEKKLFAVIEDRALGKTLSHTNEPKIL